MALEDWELCQKAVDGGYLIYNCPKAVVLHEHYHNLKTLLRQRYRYGIGQTWFRKRYKPFPFNLKTLVFIFTLLSLPIIFVWYFLLIPISFVFMVLLLLILYKDIKKGEKTRTQAFLSFPVFIIISTAECYGRLIGFFKKPTQINFGNDQLKTDRKIF
jgi:GT2 family glycosyltransferase